MNDKYNDIINLRHHISKKHPKMSLSERAAQFSSFAALTGFDDEIYETGRYTNEKIILTPEAQINIQTSLNMISENIDKSPEISITFFESDEKKEGGRYITLFSPVTKVDYHRSVIILKDGFEIPMENIFRIDI